MKFTRPFVFLLIILSLGAIFSKINITNSAFIPTKTDPYPVIDDKELRVIEIRYFPQGVPAPLYQPGDLSAQLQNVLIEGSKFHGYVNPMAETQVRPSIVDVINRYEARPNVDGNWGTTYEMILAEGNICQRIVDEDIDQVWLWVDARPEVDPGPGVEYAISSKYIQTGVNYATVATPAFCGGERSFVMMGFDYSRSADLALHSFGHYMEGLLGNLETTELFWYRFGGNGSAGYPRSERCGNVHYPPNGAIDYDYANATFVTSYCEDWDPYLTGQSKTFNCNEWGCTQEGYLKWWMQNMPQGGVSYDGLVIPNWWNFVTEMDKYMKYYYRTGSYFIDRQFLDNNLMWYDLPMCIPVMPAICPQGYELVNRRIDSNGCALPYHCIQTSGSSIVLKQPSTADPIRHR